MTVSVYRYWYGCVLQAKRIQLTTAALSVSIWQIISLAVNSSPTSKVHDWTVPSSIVGDKAGKPTTVCGG